MPTEAMHHLVHIHTIKKGRNNEKGKPWLPFVMLGAGNETFTRTVSRCFPIAFFTDQVSEFLDCSLVFRLRQQNRPKSSADVHRPVLSTPDPHSSQHRRRWSRTCRLCPCSQLPHPLPQRHPGRPSRYPTQYGSRLRVTCNAHCIARLRKSRRKSTAPSWSASACDSLSLYQDAGQAWQMGVRHILVDAKQRL